MSDILTYISIGFYIFASVLLLVYGMHCYVMLALFLRKQKRKRRDINGLVEKFWQDKKAEELPFVTFQLPVYNEAEVIERLVKSVAEVNYPKNKFEIQIVDDSSDETVHIVDSIIEEVHGNSGVDVYAVRRSERTGFKAGGLANAMKIAKGEFIAIFDSDFIVPKEFLHRTIALISNDDKIACVQGRWGHLNKRENWLTRAQSVGIDGHFAAEQGARSYNGLCINFNGTGGVWRKSAILAAGNWQADTLTEDLDLSYRVQLEGYRIIYDFDLECQAEVPNNIMALKSQQRRWAKGSIETTIKLIPRIFRSKLPVVNKVEAFLHMTHYFVAVLMLILGICTLPVLLFAPNIKELWILSFVWPVIVISAVAPCVMYTGSGLVLKHGKFSLANFPAMLALGTGLCVNNAKAVFDAVIGLKSEFVRTPKSGSLDKHKSFGRYKSGTKIWQGIIEVILGTYCIITFVVYVHAENYIFGFFIGAYAFGLTVIGLTSIGHFFKAMSLRK